MFRKIAGLMMGTLVCLLAPAAPAQVRDAGDGTILLKTSQDDITQLLGAQYKDELAGFRMCPPAGSRIINRADLDLMSYVVDAKQWGGNVQLLKLTRDYTVDEYLNASFTELSKTFPAVQAHLKQEITFQNRKAGRLTASMEAEIGPPDRTGKDRRPRERISLFRQQLMIQMALNQYMILTLYSPLKDREEATKTFEAMLKAFELLDRTAIAARRVKTIEAARKWLDDRSARELESKLITEPQMFRIRLDRRDVGFVRFEETTKDAKGLPIERDGTTGVLITVNSRVFPDDRTVIMGANDAYWAFPRKGGIEDNLEYSTYTNTSKTILNNGPGKVDQFWLMELGTLRADRNTRLSAEELKKIEEARNEMLKKIDVTRGKIPPPVGKIKRLFYLSVERTGDISQQLTESNRSFNAVLQDDSVVPLPKIFEYTWPRLVDLKTPSEMTFLSYNSTTGKPAYRTLSVLGPEKITIDNESFNAYKLSDEMDPGTTFIWVDGNGKVLMMRTSDRALLVPTTEEAMKQLWMKRIEKIPEIPTAPARTGR